MSRFVRASKYRHVFGQPAKKEHSIENVKVSSSAWDTNLINASGAYLSLNWNASGGGAFSILPLPSPFKAPHSLPYRLPDVIPLARGHTAAVLDTTWSPFDDSVVVSGGEDGNILVWKVEASSFEGWGSEHWVPIDFDPVARINGSARKVGQVQFHPTASHVIAAASGDHAVKLWDLAFTEDPKITLTGHTDTIQSIDWNPSGTLLATTCRDRKIRIFDPRASPEAVRVTEGHSGIKGTRLVWLGDKDRIATTGFSKMSDRQLCLWETGSLGNLKTITIDSSAGVIMPFWSDNNILFLAGKGDGNIRYYEYEADALHPLSEHKSADPQRGMCFLPRRALSVSDCEIARAYKVSATGIEPIAFVVPRKSDSFQSDIFPPAPSAEPALTAGEYFSGKTAPPKLVDLETGSIFSAPAGSSSSSATPSYPVHPTPTKILSVPAPTPSTPISPPEEIRAPPKKADSAPAPSPAHQPHIETPVREESYPAPTHSPVVSPSGPSSSDPALAEENARLNVELREARAHIRNLELQVETLKANVERARKVLLYDEQ